MPQEIADPQNQKIIRCVYFPKCRGCAHWDQSYDLQKQIKIAKLRSILKIDLTDRDFISIRPFGLRHRFDFTLESSDPNQAMGFYGENRKLIDIESCLQLSPELQNVFSEFRRIPMRTKGGLIRKASVRLRVSPSGLKGIWLDLANVDTKALLDDSEYLSQLLEAGFEIEIGQKGKKLGRLQGQLKLMEPVALDWFRSKSYLLKCLISDFTQPSWLTAEALVDVVLSWVQSLSLQTAIEFGPGVGQFTLPLLEKGILLHAFENNPKAVAVLQKNARQYSLDAKLKIFSGDFQNKQAHLERNFDLAFVNPPRSGLKGFVDTVVTADARFCIYISCFPESMQVDLEKLKQQGYAVKAAKIVDQFPQTDHFESCVLLQKN